MAKILLVEDDNNLREIYGARLSAEGYDIVSAPDGEEALAIAVKEKPDLIISDIMMPKISGFDMLDILRNAPETKDTKIIMMTALSQAEDKERADKLGADLYLVKSQVTLEDVAESVRKILGDDKSQPSAGQPDAPAEQPSETPAAETAAPPPVAQAEVTAAPAGAPQPDTAPPEPTSAPAPTAPSAPQTVAPPAPQTDNNTQPSAPQPQNDISATAVPASPAPAAAPSVQAPPVEPPASTPSAPVADSQPAKPEPRKIEVVLPDDETDKPAESTEEKPAESTAPAVATDAVEEDLSIGPNVAEALAQEEGSAEPAKAEVPSPTSDDPGASQPSTIIKPSETPAAENPPEESTVTQGSPNEEKNPNRKVIQPLNDPTQGPDLNALLAQEEQREQTTPAPSSPEPGAAPPVQQPPQNPPQDEHPDDFSKISL